MKVSNINYCIATKTFPLMFDDGCGNLVDYIDYADMTSDYEDCKNGLENFDNQEEFQILKVTKTYEF